MSSSWITCLRPESNDIVLIKDRRRGQTHEEQEAQRERLEDKRC